MICISTHSHNNVNFIECLIASPSREYHASGRFFRTQLICLIRCNWNNQVLHNVACAQSEIHAIFSGAIHPCRESGTGAIRTRCKRPCTGHIMTNSTPQIPHGFDVIIIGLNITNWTSHKTFFCGRANLHTRCQRKKLTQLCEKWNSFFFYVEPYCVRFQGSVG